MINLLLRIAPSLDRTAFYPVALSQEELVRKLDQFASNDIVLVHEITEDIIYYTLNKKIDPLHDVIITCEYKELDEGIILEVNSEFPGAYFSLLVLLIVMFIVPLVSQINILSSIYYLSIICAIAITAFLIIMAVVLFNDHTSLFFKTLGDFLQVKSVESPVFNENTYG